MSSHDEMTDEELWSRSRSEQKDERADALMELAHRSRVRQEWEIAKNLYGSALDLYIDLESENDAAKANYSLGYCLYRLQDYEEAISSLESALERGRELNDATVLAYSAGPLAESLAQVGNRIEAISMYELAVETCFEIDDGTQAGINSLSLGDLLGFERQQTGALESYIRAYNLFQGCGDAYGGARAKDRMASALVELGDTDQALMHIQDALDVFSFLEDEERIAEMNYRLGWIRNYAEKYLQSEKPLRAAIAVFKERQEWSRVALAETQLAMSLLYRDLDEPNEAAEEMLARVGAYFEAAGEQINVLVVDSLSADRLMIAGLFEESASLWQDILDRAIQYEDVQSEHLARLNLASCLFQLGELTKGQELFAQVDPGVWGENKNELEVIERVKNLMLEKMSETLNIDVPIKKKGSHA